MAFHRVGSFEDSLRTARGRSDIGYLALFLVVAAAVTVGNLAATWITAQVVAMQVEQAAAEARKLLATETAKAKEVAAALARSAAAQAQQSASALAAQHAALQDQRRNDRQGQQLSRACEEWRKAHADLDSYTTRSEAEKHCARFERYVQTGEAVPRK